MDDLDALDRDAESVGDELREGRLVPLAMTVRAGQHRHAAGRVDADRSAFEQPRAGAERADDRRRGNAASLDISGDAEAAQFPPRRRIPTPRFEALVIGCLQRELQCREVIAAVVLEGDRGLIRVGVLRDEIAPAQLGRIHPKLVGGKVDDALEQKGRLRAASAAIGVNRHRMGKDSLGLDIDRWGCVGAGEKGPVKICRDTGREGRQIGAHIGDRRHLQSEELRISVEGELDMGDMVAPMRVRHETLGTFRGPFDRPPHLPGGPGHDRLFGVVVDL